MTQAAKTADPIVLNLIRSTPPGALIEALKTSTTWRFLKTEVLSEAFAEKAAVNPVKHRAEIDRLNGKLETLRAKFDDIGRNADRLQEAIVAGRTDDALFLMREFVPDHQFLSVAAEKMLADIRNQPGLPL